MEFYNDVYTLTPKMPMFSYSPPYPLDFHCPKCKNGFTFEVFGVWATILLEKQTCPICKYSYLILGEME